MPSLILTQTDTAATSGTSVGCSGATIASTPQAREVSDGATAGTSELTATVAANSTQAAIMFESATGKPTNTDWAAGDWVVRLNVTTSAMDMSLEEIYVCRVNSSGVNQATVGSLTAIGQSLGSTGVISSTISGSAQTAAAGDRFYIVLVLKNSNAHTSRSIGFTPDQDVDTPVLPLDGTITTEGDDIRVIEGTDPTDIRVTENFV